MTTTKKHDSFVSGPMRLKGINQVPGIGRVLASRFVEDNINQARDLLGHFLVRKMDPARCTEFVKRYGANNKQADDAFNAMQEWCRNFL